MKTNTLLKDPSGLRPLGYIFNFDGHGPFAPDGKVSNPAPISATEVAAHNASLAALEIEAMKATGRAVLYLNLRGNDATRAEIATWDGSHKFHGYNLRCSWHNMAGCNGRTDIDFTFDGSRWHGVNIGDNQICRVRRCKR